MSMSLRNRVSQGKPIGWVLVGASAMVRDVFAPVLKRIPGGCALGILSSSSGRGAAFAAEFGFPRVYGSLEEAVTDPDADAVYISTTNDLHRDQAIAAARAGKHILCEKPLALEVEDCEAMVRAADAAGMVFAVLHHQPALPQYRVIRERIAAGAIGRPLALRVRHNIRLSRVLADSWRTRRADAGAGVFYDLGTHDADLIRFLLDDEIDSVFAIQKSAGLASEGIADHAMGVMCTRAGVLCSFHDAYLIDGISGIEVLGAEGALSAREIGPYASIPSPEVVWIRSGKSSLIESIPVEDRTNPFDRSIAAFHAALRGEGGVVRSGRDGTAAVAAMCAAIASGRSGRQEKVRPLGV
jgi:1,5-anhydro-D-fructose reductase (1,5-anhydro-D-mannitol-forming)